MHILADKIGHPIHQSGSIYNIQIFMKKTITILTNSCEIMFVLLDVRKEICTVVQVMMHEVNYICVYVCL